MKEKNPVPGLLLKMRLWLQSKPLVELNSNETIKLVEDSEFIRINSKAFKKLAENKMSMSRLINELLIEHAVFLETLN